jgi:hypothetical protein
MSVMIRRKLKENRITRPVYRGVLMASLAGTKIIGKLDLVREYDYGVPLRVSYFIDALSTSSDLAHTQISLIDEEVEREFREKTQMFERKIGIGHLYSREELEKLCDRREQIKLPEQY